MRHRHEERDRLNTKMVKLLIEILFSSRILLPQLIRTENPLKNWCIVWILFSGILITNSIFFPANFFIQIKLTFSLRKSCAFREKYFSKNSINNDTLTFSIFHFKFYDNDDKAWYQRYVWNNGIRSTKQTAFYCTWSQIVDGFLIDLGCPLIYSVLIDFTLIG